MASSEQVQDEVIPQEKGCGLGCSVVLAAMVVLFLVLNPFTMPLGMALIVVVVIIALLQRRRKRKKSKRAAEAEEDS